MNLLHNKLPCSLAIVVKRNRFQMKKDNSLRHSRSYHFSVEKDKTFQTGTLGQLAFPQFIKGASR